MTPRTLIRVALVGLTVLVATSLALVWPTTRAGSGLPPGAMLAGVKVVVLVLVFIRVRNANVYSMQWSSMLLLLFFAEGIVRATSDPPPSAVSGAVEALAATCTFVALLAYLRPLKRRSRAPGTR